MKTNSKYIIGESSEHYLNALEAFQVFQDRFIQALEFSYGDEQANEYFMEHNPKFEEIERIIMDYLRINFILEMNGKNKTITL